MRVRVVGTPFNEGRVQPTGLVNGQPWPDIGEEMDLDDAAAKHLAEVGVVEIVDGKPVEKRPAKKAAEETR